MSDAEMKPLLEDRRAGAGNPNQDSPKDRNGGPAVVADPMRPERPGRIDDTEGERGQALTSETVGGRTHSYGVVGGCLAIDGIPLCNFSAWIVETVIRDNGAGVERVPRPDPRFDRSC
jgi:hypothetical protein